MGQLTMSIRKKIWHMAQIVTGIFATPGDAGVWWVHRHSSPGRE